jgi:hypothetical protein
VHQHPVVLERERSLGLHVRERRDARGELGAAVGVDEVPDPLELVGRHRRVPRADDLDVGRRGRREVDDLEQAVDRVADLGRLQPCGARHGAALLT